MVRPSGFCADIVDTFYTNIFSLLADWTMTNILADNTLAEKKISENFDLVDLQSLEKSRKKRMPLRPIENVILLKNEYNNTTS